MPPDFIGIGAQKAGTTWLHKNLSSHPGIWMPQEKELHYFDEKLRVGRRPLRARLFGDTNADKRWRRQFRRQLRNWRRDRSRSLRWSLRYLLGRPNDRWYLSLFSPGKGRVTGEITPNYMTLPVERVEQVHRLLPEARIIFMLRNPVERAWSASVMKTRKLPPEEARRLYEQAFATRASRMNTDYERTLRNWTAFYPPEQIFIGFLEDVGREPHLLLERVCAFLGVSEPAPFEEAGQVIHGGYATTMPGWVGTHLATQYTGLVDRLAARFGGYADFWRFCAERLRADPGGEEEIPYPCWQTSLWEEWIAAGGEPPAGVQSGTLAQISPKG